MEHQIIHGALQGPLLSAKAMKFVLLHKDYVNDEGWVQVRAYPYMCWSLI